MLSPYYHRKIKNNYYLISGQNKPFHITLEKAWQITTPNLYLRIIMA